MRDGVIPIVQVFLKIVRARRDANAKGIGPELLVVAKPVDDTRIHILSATILNEEKRAAILDAFNSTTEGMTSMSSYRQLSQAERIIIAWLRQRQWSLCQIARFMGRSPSTISREVRRNCSRSDGGYRSEPAQYRVNARRRKSRQGTHLRPDELRLVVKLVKRKWSPEQISSTLARDGLLSISHETIYRFIRNNRKHGGSLYTHLRQASKRRRKRHGTSDSRGILPGKRHISERPIEVDSRLSMGHWEGDTVVGSDRHHCVLTLVERSSGFAVIKKLPARTATNVTAAALKAVRQHSHRFKTLTLDNGTEFHGYKNLEAACNVVCYFANPYHSWERGSNENLNGLLRQYLPKGTSMAALTQVRCDRIATQLNTRPRKRHGFKTPQEVFYAAS
jgi:transposase, IS30 family